MKEHEMLEALGGIRPAFVLESLDFRAERKRERRFALLHAAAAILLCLGIAGAGITSMAGGMRGLFRDIFRWDGAVTGTAYEAAEGEVLLAASYEKGGVRILVTAEDSSYAPWTEIEQIRIKTWRVRDIEGKTLFEGEETEYVPFAEAGAALSLPLSGFSSGEYVLTVSEMEGGKKADSPLAIRGDWECGFKIP